MMRTIRRRVGDIVMVPLGAGFFAFAQVLREPLMVFFDVKADRQLPIDEIQSKNPAFSIWVANNAVTKGEWRVIGSAAVDPSIDQKPLFFKKDALSGALSLTHDGTDELPVGNTNIEHLERAAVWEPTHVVDRLNDHFAGRPNVWALQLR